MNRTERLENLSAAIDQELTEQELMTLRAWTEIHPEDLHDIESVAEVVGLVRELGQVEPPADLRQRILRAVAETTPVEVPRDQALEWLDGYFEDDLSLPQRQVVDHYLAVDADFAETARVHAAMFNALRGVAEAEPPSDLASRIRAKTGPGAERGARPHRGRPVMTAKGYQRIAMTAVAVMVLAVVFAAGRNSGRKTNVVATPPTAQPHSPVLPPAPVGPTVVEGLPANDNPPLTSGKDSGVPATPKAATPLPSKPPASSVAESKRTPAHAVPRGSTRNSPSQPGVKDGSGRRNQQGQRPPDSNGGIAAPVETGVAAETGRERSVEGAGAGGILNDAKQGHDGRDPLAPKYIPPF